MLDRQSPPKFHRISQINIPDAAYTALDNGIPVYTIAAGKQPVTRVEFIFNAGSWFEKSPGASYFATKMLSEGTSSLSSATISNEIEKYGAHLELSSSMDFAVMTLECLNKQLPHLLPLIHELLYDSAFPENEFLTLKKIKSQQIRVSREKTSTLASIKFRESLFGKSHPYGKDLTVKDVEDLQLEDVVQFYQTFFRGKFQIVASGQPTPEFHMLINQLFGSKALVCIAADAEFGYEDVPGEKLVVEEKPKNIQSSIRLGKKLFTKNHPDLIDMLILNEILGGYFGSRLMKNIREEKGYTYGISSSIITLKNEGFFIVGTDVNKENTQNTIDEIFKEIDILQSTNVPDEELETVKNYMVGSFLSDINTPFALADKFKAVHLNDMDLQFYKNFIERINTISAEDIKDIANKHLDAESLRTIVVGGLK